MKCPTCGKEGQLPGIVEAHGGLQAVREKLLQVDNHLARAGRGENDPLRRANDDLVTALDTHIAQVWAQVTMELKKPQT